MRRATRGVHGRFAKPPYWWDHSLAEFLDGGNVDDPVVKVLHEAGHVLIQKPAGSERKYRDLRARAHTHTHTHTLLYI